MACRVLLPHHSTSLRSEICNQSKGAVLIYLMFISNIFARAGRVKLVN
jgi:hypothetical protein